jgi:beta-phosphoglucomutase
MRVEAILCDFDGVMVDSEPIRFAAGASALSEVGLALTWDTFLRFWFGRTDRAGLGDILGARFATDGQGVVARRNAIVEGRLHEIPLFADAQRFLDRLPPTLRLGIVTGSRRVEVDAILQRVLPNQKLDAITSAEDYRRAKPDPDPFLAGARRLGCDPAGCLAIEDSPAGISAARGAGMQTVGVERSRFLPLSDATWRIKSLDELTLTPDGEVRVRPPSE